jgi:hypothetical protein
MRAGSALACAFSISWHIAREEKAAGPRGVGEGGGVGHALCMHVGRVAGWARPLRASSAFPFSFLISISFSISFFIYLYTCIHY